MDIEKVLSGTTVFADFDAAAIARLAAVSSLREYSTGEVIIRRGLRSESVGVVVSGELSVHLKPELQHLELSRVTEGAVIGEFGLLTGDPAVADLLAKVPSRVVHVPYSQIMNEIARNPLATRGFATLMASRFVNRRDSVDFRALARNARRVGDDSGMKQPVLVINMGSSSLKYALYQTGQSLLHGTVERIGGSEAEVVHHSQGGRLDRKLGKVSHEEALGKVMELLVHPEFGALTRLEELGAVGHRVVHGGDRFNTAIVIDENVLSEISRCASLAPLHNPVNIAGIEICRRLLPPSTPQVAVFDTAFHMTMPEHAWTYALPAELSRSERLRRYGFHGTSHKYVDQAVTTHLETSPGSLKIVSCHLGNGASVAAINHGRSVDTSMGLTPLEGLIMGTRSGDVDPGLILHLMALGKSREEVAELLNRKSGLLGISGLSADMRELEKAADAGHEGAMLAIAAFCYRVRKYIGAYAAAMGGIDVLAFTGGIGQNAVSVRQRIARDLVFLGIEIDQARNAAPFPAGELAQDVSKEGSAVRILVVPTDEEGTIARESIEALQRSGVSEILTSRQDRPVPIGVSAHHVHLKAADIMPLFGKEKLTLVRELTQKGNWACEETVDLVGPRGEVKKVRVLGPERDKTQVEVSRTDEFKLGIDAPIRASGDVANSPGITLRGTVGSITIPEGVICAARHIHMDPADAMAFGVHDKDIVRVNVPGERSLIFGDVLVRVYPGWSLEMHLDTDEANAAEVNAGMTCTIESIQKRA